MSDTKLGYQKARMEKIAGVVTHGITAVSSCFCVYIIFISLKDIALGQPQSLEALADVFRALKLDSITAYLVGAGGVAYGFFERRQKKRIISEKGKLQKELEAGPWRTTSKLTSTGDNPESKL